MAIAYGSPSARTASAAADAKGTHPGTAKKSAGTGKRRAAPKSSGEEEGGDEQEEEGVEEEEKKGKAGGPKPTAARASKEGTPSLKWRCYQEAKDPSRVYEVIVFQSLSSFTKRKPH